MQLTCAKSFVTKNKVSLIGYVGQTPEFKPFFPKEGQAAAPTTAPPRGVWSFSVASNNRFKRANSTTWESQVEWHTIKDFSNILWKYTPGSTLRVDTGALVSVEGRLHYWKSESGRTYTQLVAESVNVLKPAVPKTKEETETAVHGLSLDSAE
ncbi:hypothetical protein HDU98_009491 [Podochytrium sp. JEL0797]|nr:hypothetical protein HDU98_009488 [Podochytrium sp. JEL0797]KAJ3067329.1 hypothetical protein HDU98_009491 [Podochytrium sp. JEL0797]